MTTGTRVHWLFMGDGTIVEEPKYGFCKVEWDSGAGRSVLACDALTVLS